MNCVDGQPHAYIAISVLCITASLSWVYQDEVPRADRTRAPRALMRRNTAAPWLRCSHHDSSRLRTHLGAVGAVVVRQLAVSAKAASTLRPVTARTRSSYPRRSSHLPELWRSCVTPAARQPPLLRRTPKRTLRGMLAWSSES